MANTLSLLMRELVPDSWRSDRGFSVEVQETLSGLLEARSDERRQQLLSAWLQEYQPCLFGRIAAQRDLISYCMLTVDDIQRGDEFVRDKIQDARRQWYVDAEAGRRSGFVISVLSSELAAALPGPAVSAVAKRIAGLYLLLDDGDVALDTIYLDHIRLEAQLPGRPTFEWDVGVNYFSAQGDRRWWQDHRAPVGLALSMNSVGHMVKATHQSRATSDLAAKLGVATEDVTDSTMDSLGKALKVAMMTIDRAADAVSGKATWLLPHPGPAERGQCPVRLPASIADRDHSEYAGYYHTDVTLPSLYFRPEIERPQDVTSLQLDLTYLDETATDPIDRMRVGGGRRVRSAGDEELTTYSKRGKAEARLITRRNGSDH